MTSIWTDEALYAEFGITDSEIKIIEQWYAKWKK
jgi:hypothetical protein